MPFVHDTFFDEREFFIMIDDDLIKLFQIIHTIHHDLGRFHIVSVIGKRHSSSETHIAHFCKLFALLSLCQCTDDFDVNEADLFRPRLQTAHQGGGVYDRACIRHSGDRREASCSRRLRAGQEILFRFLPRLTQMRVHINEAGNENLAADIDDFGLFIHHILIHLLNNAVLDKNIQVFI